MEQGCLKLKNAAEILYEQKKISSTIVDARFCKPLDKKLNFKTM